MEDAPAKGQEKQRPDTAVSKESSKKGGDEKPAGRARSRSIWRKGKDKEKAAPALPPTSIPS